ncbi:3'-5' exoribonuclease YhaM family protein [Paenibacillus eucommiae]|uniref:3'-5' exoribonuclease n=1 Tax=Paenibacillus eucommiae TaxID=1355755 RepID=A0ABS4IMT1_9BACL|nr:HD domain-containing protein [Paenibacillus eucommiae]MBP1988875.1 3'-5' exoribonuclease [Paenibacillus eucommiae]
MTLIKTFSAGDEIVGFYLLKSADVKQTNTTPPKDYFDFVFMDQSGEIGGKLWDVSAVDKETYFPMMLVKIQGLVQLYKEKPQLKIMRIRKAEDEDGVALADFIRSAPIQPVDLLYVIKQTISSIQDAEIKAIVEYIHARAEDKLMHYPAAKGIHHAYYAGLAYHIVRMLELGEFIIKQRPFLQPDLIRAGIILHDIAKTEEMNAELGVATDYSLTGRLLGHISIASNWIVEAAIQLGIGTSNLNIVALQHLILSHHNLGEWGSPVQPQLPEAVALHYIDQLDAKLQAVEDAIDITPESEEWTAPVRAVEYKQIYLMKRKENGG